jgi:predicted TIM-barrel fold metal-dependent hydrolase
MPHATGLPVVDAHVHVGLLGDRWPQWGRLSPWYQKQVVYRIFLLYSRIPEDRVCDQTLREATIEIIDRSTLDKVVCLSLDPVYDKKRGRCEDRSHVWVDNDYVLALRDELPGRILFGASVHPYDPLFRDRLHKYVDAGAVLMKWLPSAQQIDLADDATGRAMIDLATARPGGKPLPLLLHVGPEYAIPSSDPTTLSYDFLSWSSWDRFWNWFRGRQRWRTPQVGKIHANIRAALGEGAVIILAHCGLPYFSTGLLSNLFEHSDFKTVRRFLMENEPAKYPGRCYADVSACCTPFRKKFFTDINRLPADYLLYGSDFPTPSFELAADLGDVTADLKAVLNGHLDRILVPEGNLLDVNCRELRRYFPEHPLFTNFNRLL